ncbi:hypothetical protein COCON_G00233640 [Conger conger]|uniref:Uncharacterized protein n=1 Tax=Conger conger TaxID=82655 RepID=A0A9Q1CUL0_CONCO|nr:hypothetical protein COCON_G00233640 [Conger conger]
MQDWGESIFYNPDFSTPSVGVWQWAWLDCWYIYEAHLAAIIQFPRSIKAWLHSTPVPNYFRRQIARVPRLLFEPSGL